MANPPEYPSGKTAPKDMTSRDVLIAGGDVALQSSTPRNTEAPILRVFRLALGWLWAMLLALMGVGLWHERLLWMDLLHTHDPAVVVALVCLCLAGAQFVFMLLVADDLCPRTPAGLTLFLKIFAGTVIWLSLLWLGVQVWG